MSGMLGLHALLAARLAVILQQCIVQDCVTVRFFVAMVLKARQESATLIHRVYVSFLRVNTLLNCTTYY